MRHLSIVVPVYNSAQGLTSLVDRLGAVLPGLAAEYEVILVNDGSRDQSWPAILDLMSRTSWLRGIDLMRNYGQHNALLCGIRAARYDTIVTVDDDLQNPPEEIGKLLSKLEEGYDVVYGVPEREQHGLMRDIASRLTKRAMQSAMGAETASSVSAFRAFRSLVCQAFADYQSPNVNIDVLLTWGTSRFGAVVVQHEKREFGSSNYNFGRLIIHALNMMTGFSTAPLRLASFVGFGFTLFGCGTLAYVLITYLIRGTTQPGFPFLASLISIFSGAQMFALGIIGEYLARMHSRTMDRPPYAVRTTSTGATQRTAAPCGSTNSVHSEDEINDPV